jgi:hypothetical protein
MKLALIALAALVPALAFADDPAPYVLHEGRAANAPAGGSSASSKTSTFGTKSIRPGISAGIATKPAAGARASGSVRAFRSTHRSSGHHGMMGAAPTGGGAATPAPSAPPAYATPGAMIRTAGQQPVYSTPAGGGTHSVEGGGMIAIDQSRANDVGRAPGITWAPPDTPPSAGAHSGGGGTGASSNGPAAGAASSNAGAPTTAPTTNRGSQGVTGFDASF